MTDDALRAMIDRDQIRECLVRLARGEDPRDAAMIVETQVISYHRVEMEAGERDTCIGGRYLDRMRRRDGIWRIAERTMLYDWFQDWGASADWSQGVMGMAFSSPHFSGRSVGDHSEQFCGQ